MAGTKLDGAGASKMKTIEEAFLILQRLHGIVESMAMELKKQKPTAVMGLQLRRAGTPLVGLLKGQFGVISDQVASMLLVATRGGAEQQKVRGLRENIAAIRTALEITSNKVKEQHTVEVELSAD